jgi:prolipoprotein diacylglyceryl transferase
VSSHIETVLASIPSPPVSWQYFNIGPLQVHTYALCILLGIILAVWMTSVRLTKRGGGKGVTLDMVLWVVPLGIIVARFYHVFTHPSDYFYPGADLLRVFYIWEGGNAIFGALLGGALGVYLGSRQTGVRFLSFADALVPGLLVAQAAGRLGKYFNHELFGLPTTLPWGLEIESSNPAFPAGLPDGTLFQPTFLYEIVWNLIGVAVILFLERRVNLRWGRALGVYLVWYGLGRSWLESIRIDPSETFWGIRTNIWAAFFAIIIGVVLLIWSNRRHTGRELSVYRPGRHSAPSAIDSEAGEPARYHVGKVASSDASTSSISQATSQSKVTHTK